MGNTRAKIWKARFPSVTASQNEMKLVELYGSCKEGVSAAMHGSRRPWVERFTPGIPSSPDASLVNVTREK